MSVSKTPRWMKVTLVISLALNVGIAGVIGGAMLRAPTFSQDHGGVPDAISLFGRAMPQNHQRELRSTLRDKQTDLRHERDTIQNLRDLFIASLSSEPFDIDKVDAVLRAQRTTLTDLTATGHVALIEQIGKMSAEDRARYIDNLQRPPRPRPPRDQN